MPIFRLISGWGMGMGIHMDRARLRAKIGAVMNSMEDDANGRRGSLMNSFIASANGCKSPYGPTTLGPLRNCM